MFARYLLTSHTHKTVAFSLPERQIETDFAQTSPFVGSANEITASVEFES